jgi:hypothetical protein
MSEKKCDRCQKPFKPAHCDACYDEGWRLYQESVDEARRLRALIRAMRELTRVDDKYELYWKM